jgi:hypothetical protein
MIVVSVILPASRGAVDQTDCLALRNPGDLGGHRAMTRAQ